MIPGALDKENRYFCGRCRHEIAYSQDDEPTIPCPECGYQHKDRRDTDVPAEFKLDLNNY